MTTIGLCGAGVMGRSAAGALIKAGRSILVFDSAQDAR